MNYQIANDVKGKIDVLVDKLQYSHIKKNRIYCIRSFDVKTRAYARIWGMAKLFSEVAGVEPRYIIEVNSKKFDKLNPRDQLKTLIHELMHIPKTFSGALLSHRGPHHRINDREVEKILQHMMNQ